jgi:hypothetical protein
MTISPGDPFYFSFSAPRILNKILNLPNFVVPKRNARAALAILRKSNLFSTLDHPARAASETFQGVR